MAAERPRLVVRYGEGPPPLTVVRGPFLQTAAPTTMVVSWRSSVPSDTRLDYGSDPADLDTVVTDPAVVRDHVVTLTELLPATRYYYAVGSTEEPAAGWDETFFFETIPSTTATLTSSR